MSAFGLRTFSLHISVCWHANSALTLAVLCADSGDIWGNHWELYKRNHTRRGQPLCHPGGQFHAGMVHHLHI